MIVHARQSLALLAAGCTMLAPCLALAQEGGGDVNLESEDFVFVEMSTNMGDLIIEVDTERAPVTAENFLQYVRDDYYDGLVFHRIVPDFVIQGGGFKQDYSLAITREPIENEWMNGLTNVRGSLSMARTNDPASATSQFFINLKDNANLDQPMSGGAGYAVFGYVVEGMDVVDKIAGVSQGTKTTAQGAMQNVPNEPVVIESATIIEDEETIKALNASQRDGRSSREEAIEARLTLLAELKKQREEREMKAEQQVQEQIDEARALLEEKDVAISGAETTDSGLWYVITEEGEGESPTIRDEVVCHYRLWLPDGREVDSSFARNQPATFPLARVIKGWQEGVQLLKPGGKAYFIVPPELGYGQTGAGGTIPPNAVLVFEVQLLEVK